MARSIVPRAFGMSHLRLTRMRGKTFWKPALSYPESGLPAQRPFIFDAKTRRRQRRKERGSRIGPLRSLLSLRLCVKNNDVAPRKSPKHCRQEYLPDTTRVSGEISERATHRG